MTSNASGLAEQTLAFLSVRRYFFLSTESSFKSYFAQYN